MKKYGMFLVYLLILCLTIVPIVHFVFPQIPGWIIGIPLGVIAIEIADRLHGDSARL